MQQCDKVIMEQWNNRTMELEQWNNGTIKQNNGTMEQWNWNNVAM